MIDDSVAGLKSGNARRTVAPPPSFLAFKLLTQFNKKPQQATVYIARSERQASSIFDTLRAIAPAIPMLLFRPWDCLPYDRIPPSRECMGRRMKAMAAILNEVHTPWLIVTSLDAVLQRIPPAAAIKDSWLALNTGEVLDLEQLKKFAARTGYILDDRVDEAGEIAFLDGIV